MQSIITWVYILIYKQYSIMLSSSHMKIRKTLEEKKKFLSIRITEDERAFLKIKAAERGISITRLVLESIRRYLREDSNEA